MKTKNKIKKPKILKNKYKNPAETKEFKKWLKVFLKEDAGILDELANR